MVCVSKRTSTFLPIFEILLVRVQTSSLAKNVRQEFVYIEIFGLELYKSCTAAEVALNRYLRQ